MAPRISAESAELMLRASVLRAVRAQLEELNSALAEAEADHAAPRVIARHKQALEDLRTSQRANVAALVGHAREDYLANLPARVLRSAKLSNPRGFLDYREALEGAPETEQLAAVAAFRADGDSTGLAAVFARPASQAVAAAVIAGVGNGVTRHYLLAKKAAAEVLGALAFPDGDAMNRAAVDAHFLEDGDGGGRTVDDAEFRALTADPVQQ